MEIDSPEVALKGTICQENAFIIRMQVATDGHDSARHVYNGLDPVAELLFGPLLKLRAGNGGRDQPPGSQFIDSWLRG